MKNKTLTIILSAVLIICIGANIYQYMTTLSLQESLSLLTNTKNELTSNIENKTTKLNNITSEIAVANTTISELTAKVESLTQEIQDTQEEIDSINSTHTDIELGDGEYKGDTGNDALESIYNNASEETKSAADASLERAKKKHPEWFQDDTTGSTDNTKAPGYVSVDAPVDNGEIPPAMEFNGDYSGGVGATVY